MKTDQEQDATETHVDFVSGIAVHPGFVASGLYDHQTLFLPLTATFITVDEGALSSLWAATSPEIDEKKLFGRLFFSSLD